MICIISRIWLTIKGDEVKGRKAVVKEGGCEVRVLVQRLSNSRQLLDG